MKPARELCHPPIYRILLTAFIALIALLHAEAVSAQSAEPNLMPVPDPNASLYASFGIGFINIDERGPGVRSPLGLGRRIQQTAPHRSHQPARSEFPGGQPARRALRAQLFSLRSFQLLRHAYGLLRIQLPLFGGTDLLPSASVELNYIALREVWLANHRGKVFAGAGWRLRDPRGAFWQHWFLF